MKQLLTVTLLVAAGAAPAATGFLKQVPAPGARIAVVDIDRIYRESSHYAKLKAEIEKAEQGWAKELDKIKAAAKLKETEISSLEPGTQERDRQLLALSKLQHEGKQLSKMFQIWSKQRRTDANLALFLRIEKTIAAQAKGRYDLVLKDFSPRKGEDRLSSEMRRSLRTRASMIYHSDALDITTSIIKLVDA